METFECIEKRRSIRKFLDIPVEWEKVGNILRAAQLAPSAGNMQGWKFIVVTDKDKKKAVADAALGQFWMEHAPILIVVYAEPQKSKKFYGKRGEEMYAMQDCSAALENMLLAATDQDLGACWISAFEDGMLSRVLEAPENVEPQGIIAIGYPDEDPPAPAKYQLVDLVYLQTWGNKISNVDLVMQDWSEVVRNKLVEAKEYAETEGKAKGIKLFEKGKEKIKEIHEKIKEKHEDFKEKRKKKDDELEEDYIVGRY